MNATRDMILALRGPAVERPIEIPKPPTVLSPETQAQLHAFGAIAALSERRRRWLLFRRVERLFAAEQRPVPEIVLIDWAAMRARKVS